jgi:YaiO family outer membrane protein
VESYPVLRKGTYLYTGIGLSKSDLFPSFRLGLEVFQALPRDFEGSLGLRYLEVPDKQIPIYVSSIGKYWQSYWISVKSYISPSNSSLSKSWIFSVRKYLSNPSNFLEWYAGSGVSPDTDLGGEEVDFLGSRSFGFTFKLQVKPQYDVNMGVHFSNLETRSNAFRGDTGVQLSLSRNF